MNDLSAADALRDLIDRTGRRYAVKMSGFELYKVADLAQKVLAERDQLHTLAVSLAAFVDHEHETKPATGCHPEPGVDCVDWCEACALLATVPADLLAAVRAQAADR